MAFRSGPVAPGVAFITGGARGLGNAIGVSFSKEGARGVCLVDIQDEPTFEQGKKNVERYGAKVGLKWPLLDRDCSRGSYSAGDDLRPGTDRLSPSHRSCASAPM